MTYLGANLEPEGLETGEFKVNAVAQFTELEPIFIIAYLGNQLPLGTSAPYVIYNVNEGSCTVNGIPTSVAYIVCSTSAAFNQIMNNLQIQNFSDYVLTAFTVPKFALQDFINDTYKISPNTYILYNYPSGSGFTNNFMQSVVTKTLNSRPVSIDSYTPRNQKLLTYPYLYLGFNPQGGSSKILRYEDFSNATPSFDFISEVNPNPTINIIPKNYRGNTGQSLTDNMTINGYPTLSTRSDNFNIWLAQNSDIIKLNMEQEEKNYIIDQTRTGIEGFTNMFSKAFSNDASGLTDAITMGLNIKQQDINHEYYVKNQMAQVEKQRMLPDKVTLGSSATLLGYNLLDNDIFARYSIKRQFAEKIDKFFDMYGYLTNTVKIPNINNRPNWNYVKTIGANIIADIPQMDLQAIKNLFNNGITLWHNANTFLDYSQNNR